MSKNVLYISYNGIREPLVQGQVLNYLEGLQENGFSFFLLTFEREEISKDEIKKTEEELSGKRITWNAIPVNKLIKPISTFFDVHRGARIANEICQKHEVRLIHARSLVPALIARKVKEKLHIPYLYDIRGFWVDEKVFKGSMRQGSFVHRVAKRLEEKAYKESDAVVSLTDAAIEEIKGFSFWNASTTPPMATIPTCVDIERFSSGRVEHEGPVTFGYVGSLGQGYLAEEVLDYFRAAGGVFPDSKLLILTRTDHKWLHRLAEKKGIAPSSIEINTVEPEEIPGEVNQMDVGLSFWGAFEPNRSMIAASPTKLGEYLAAGVPVVANRGIGDVDKIIEGDNAGVLLEDFSRSSVIESLGKLKGMIRSEEVSIRCAATAKKYYSLEQGVLKYNALYREILDS